jgi:uncharacterized protein YqjF (DUF2071 family)
MKVEERTPSVTYCSERKPSFGHGRTDIVIQPGESVHAGELENFLTARFRLYSAANRRVFTAPIEHDPWRLRSAKVLRLEENLIANSGLPTPAGQPIVHYSIELDVKIGRIEAIS